MKQKFTQITWMSLNIFIFLSSCVFFYYSSSSLNHEDWTLNKYSKDIYTISASIIAAYIFYFINSFLPNLRDRANYRKIVGIKIKEIINELSRYVFIIKNQSNDKKIIFPVADFKEIINSSEKIRTSDTYKSFSLIDPSSERKCTGNSILYFITDSVNKSIDKIRTLQGNSLIKENELLLTLEVIEEKLSLTQSLLSIIKQSNPNIPLSSLLNISHFDEIFIYSKQLANYYNNNLNNNDKLLESDIWFNSDAKEAISSNDINKLINFKNLNSGNK